MSLRARIILLFVGLAVVPLLILAAVSYWHAQSLVKDGLRVQMAETAASLGQEVRSRALELRRGVDRLAAGTFASEVSRGPGTVRGRDVDLPEELGEAQFVRGLGVSGDSRILAGEVPEASVRCDAPGGSRLIRMSPTVPVTGSVGDVEVGFWAADVLPEFGRGSFRDMKLVDGGSGRVLFSSDCEDLEGDPIDFIVPDMTAAPDTQTAAQGLGAGREPRQTIRATYTIPGFGWILIVSSGSPTVLHSLNRLVLSYWVFVLVLAGSTVLAFSMLLGRVTSSLRDLTRVAEEIGEGELHPWLPVPPSGEVGRLTLAFDRMLSRIRQMMAQVDQNGRLAVVGQLSAYLAHEIRNPLSSIKLNLQRLMRWARSGRIPEYCLEPLEISLNEVERLNSSVNAVLQLSRSQDGPREVVALHELLDEAGALLADRFRRQRVELRMDLDAGADWALARPGQVKSVILNLMVNALEAQPDGGRLSIRSELTRRPGGRGPAVALHFRDEGPGIPGAIRDRIFEPFFTTKKNGSGIGLAVAAQAVRDNGGRIYLADTGSHNAGAEFVVVFPLAAIEASRRAGGDRSEQEWLPESVAASVGERDAGIPEQPSERVPAHLLTPEGIEALIALSAREAEEVN